MIYQPGEYKLSLRYRAGGGNAVIYVNGKKAGTVELNDTDGEWDISELEVKLKKGENTVEVKIAEDLPSKLYVDCFTLDLI